MRSSNHFILRNGKISIKTQRNATPSIAKPKMYSPTIHDPALIRNTHANPNSDMGIANKDTGKKCFCRLTNVDDQVHAIKKYYESALEEFQQKVTILQNELRHINSQILKLEHKQLFSKQQLQTRPESKVYFQQKQQSQLSCQDLLILPKHTKSKSQMKINIKTVDDLNMTSYQWIKQWEGLSKKLKVGNKDVGKEIKRTLESSNDCGQSYFCETSAMQCSGVSQVSGIEAEINFFAEDDKIQQEKDDNVEDKIYFDSAPLMTSLGRSAILAQKIKKILEPKGVENGPVIRPVSEKNEKTEDREIQLENFIDQLMKKHEEMVLLLEKLQIQKQEEMRNIQEYYENVIKQVEQQHLLKTGNGNKSCGNFHKRQVKYWGEGNKQNKEGRKGEGEVIVKGIGRRSLD